MALRARWVGQSFPRGASSFSSSIKSRSWAQGTRAEGEREGKHVPILIINAILGVVLLFLTNLVLADDIPINLITVIICAILGVLGWALLLILHLLGIAF